MFAAFGAHNLDNSDKFENCDNLIVLYADILRRIMSDGFGLVGFSLGLIQ